MSQIKSPCTLVCSIDQKTGYCFGCARTGGEITNWVNYSHIERDNIMSQKDERMATIEQKPRRVTKRKMLAKNQVR